MASPSVTKRIAESVLTDLLEHEHLPAIEVDGDDLELPTASIVERLLLLAYDIQLRRTRLAGEVVDLTFRLDQPERPATDGGS